MTNRNFTTFLLLCRCQLQNLGRLGWVGDPILAMKSIFNLACWYLLGARYIFLRLIVVVVVVFPMYTCAPFPTVCQSAATLPYKVRKQNIKIVLHLHHRRMFARVSTGSNRESLWLPSSIATRFVHVYCIKISVRVLATHSSLSPHVRESAIRNLAYFCSRNPESTMVWNPESTLVWNPESRRLESGIQRVGIQNPDAGIRNLEAGIQNPGPSWILLHGAIHYSKWKLFLYFQMRMNKNLLG